MKLIAIGMRLFLQSLCVILLLGINLSCAKNNDHRIFDSVDAIIMQSTPLLRSLREKYPQGKDWSSYLTRESYPLIWNSEYGIRDRYILTIQMHLNRDMLINKEVVEVEKVGIFFKRVASIRVLDDGRVSVRYSQGQITKQMKTEGMDSDQRETMLRTIVDDLLERMPEDPDPVPDFLKIFEES